METLAPVCFRFACYACPKNEPAASCQCWWDVNKADVDVVAGVIDVAQEIKQAIEDFKPYIPLIQGLRNPGMRQRHWDIVRSISCIIRYDNDPVTKTQCQNNGRIACLVLLT